MRYVKITFRLIHYYVYVLVLFLGLLYQSVIGLNTFKNILILAVPLVVFSTVYIWKHKSFFELYEISNKTFKIYYCFFGMRLRIVSLQFDRIRKLDRFQYQLINPNETYSLVLNLEIDETELILKNSKNRRIFKSFNLDSMHQNHRDMFESIFDDLIEGKSIG